MCRSETDQATILTKSDPNLAGDPLTEKVTKLKMGHLAGSTWSLFGDAPWPDLFGQKSY
jgi:hypothetical protein